MSKIDLHIHSVHSDDGDLSVARIAELARQNEMRLIAITDHNSVRGVAELLGAGVPALSGVELDCSHRGRGFHLLGYGFDHARPEFDEIERDIFRQEAEAASRKLRLFRAFTGVPIAEEEVLRAAKGGIVTGELIAEIALAREDAASYPALRPYLPGGARGDMPNVNAYWDLFAPGKPAHVPIRYIELSDAAALIRAAGGVAVLAHPGQNLAAEEDALLLEILGVGVSGIEAFSSYHSPERAAHDLEIARRHGLLVSAGSDFHGKHKPNIAIGGHRASVSDDELLARLGRWLTMP